VGLIDGFATFTMLFLVSIMLTLTYRPNAAASEHEHIFKVMKLDEEFLEINNLSGAMDYFKRYAQEYQPQVIMCNFNV